MSDRFSPPYKNHRLEESYAVRSINSMLASVNSFLIFMDWPDCKVKSLKVQRQVYCAEEKEQQWRAFDPKAVFHFGCAKAHPLPRFLK